MLLGLLDVLLGVLFVSLSWRSGSSGLALRFGAARSLRALRSHVVPPQHLQVQLNLFIECLIVVNLLVILLLHVQRVALLQLLNLLQYPVVPVDLLLLAIKAEAHQNDDNDDEHADDAPEGLLGRILQVIRSCLDVDDLDAVVIFIMSLACLAQGQALARILIVVIAVIKAPRPDLGADLSIGFTDQLQNYYEN